MKTTGSDPAAVRATPRSVKFSLAANYDPELVPALAAHPVDEVYGRFPTDGVSSSRLRYMVTPFFVAAEGEIEFFAAIEVDEGCRESQFAQVTCILQAVLAIRCGMLAVGGSGCDKIVSSPFAGIASVSTIAPTVASCGFPAFTDCWPSPFSISPATGCLPFFFSSTAATW